MGSATVETGSPRTSDEHWDEWWARIIADQNEAGTRPALMDDEVYVGMLRVAFKAGFVSGLSDGSFMDPGEAANVIRKVPM